MASNPAQSASLPATSSDTASRIAVDLRRLPWIRRLATDYAFNYPGVGPFFAGDPTDRAAWDSVIRQAQSHPRRRGDLVSVIARQQDRRGAPSQARAAASQLLDPRTVAVVTGQQAGLFGGPLFTLLKALTTIKLAQQVAREHGVPAVAVFWIDAEDHDWDEVRSCTVLDEALDPHDVALPSRSHNAPVATITLDASVDAALADLEAHLAPTEFRDALLADLRAAYRPGVSVVQSFGCWLEQVLGDRGLVVFDSADPAAKPLAAEVFVAELSSPGETARRAAAAGAALVERGYHAQVQAPDDGLALFFIDGGRRAIRRQDDQLTVGDERYSREAFVERAAAEPESFSPNVLLRPIVQDTLFPTICYVAGPNELAYLGQLKGIYQHFDVPMPLMYPRASMTLVDSAALRFLHKYQLPLEALQAQDESALNQLLQAQIPASVEASFKSAASAIASGMERLIQTLPALDPTLEGAAKSALGKMQHDLQTLHGKIIQAAKRRDETLRRQYIRTRALTFPGGEAQERAIGFVSFLNQYGPALIDRLDQELPLDFGHHWVVAI